MATAPTPPVRVLLGGLAAAAVLAAAPAPQSVRLNDPLARSLGGTVFAYDLTPDGSLAVFNTVEGTSVLPDLRSAPPDGSGVSQRINEAGQTLRGPYDVSADGTRLAFLAGSCGLQEIHVAPSDGNSNPVLVAAVPTDCDSDVAFRISPDGAWVVYRDGDFDLYSVPSDASQAPVLLQTGRMTRWGFDPASEHVFLVLDSAPSDPLLRVPIDGGPVVTLGTNLVPFSVSATDFAVTPDGARVVYRADQDTPGRIELFSVPADGGLGATKLNPPLVAGGDVATFRLTSDGSRVVYLADQATDESPQLFSVPLVGPGGVVTLTADRGPDVAIAPLDVELTADDERVVFRGDWLRDEVFELFSVPAAGDAPPIRLNGRLAPGGDVASFRLTPDGRRVVYLADQDMDGRHELYAVPADGARPRPGVTWVRSELAVKVSGPLGATGGISRYAVGSASTHVAYRADVTIDGVAELWGAPLDGSGAVRLSAPLLPNGEVELDVRVTPTGNRVLYRTLVEEATSSLGVFTAPLDGSVPATLLTDDFPPGPVIGDVGTFALSPDGRDAVFVAPQDQPGRHELYAVPTDRSAPPVAISGTLVPGGDVVATGDPLLTPDGARAVYVADARVNDVHELFSAPLDGSAEPARLSGDPVAGGDVDDEFRIAPDGVRAVWLADSEADAVFELFSAPVDGSGAPVKLSGPLTTGGDVTFGGFEITADSGRVVFLADAQSNDRVELYSTPLDGSAPRVKVSVSSPGGPARDVLEFALSPDGQRAVYIADHGGQDDDFQLLSAFADSMGNPLRLHPLLAGGRDVDAFAIDPTSTRVVFRADLDTDDVLELYSTPIDANDPVKLNGPLVAGGDVGEGSAPGFAIAPDGSRVVYVADQDTDGVVELYSVPLDASAPPVKLNGALVPGGRVGVFPSRYFRIAPDGRHVVYLASQDDPFHDELYAVPIAGGPPVKLNAPLVGDVLAFELAPDSRQVLYLGDPDVANLRSLYRVPLDRSFAPVRVSGLPAAPFNVLGTFRITADARRVVYLADEAEPGVSELWSGRLPAFPDRAGPPEETATRGAPVR